MNQKSKVLVGLVLTALSLGVQAADCVKPTNQEIEGLFDRWNASLQTLNPDAVLANYDTDAVLLPTMSNQMRVNPAEIRDYFVHFLAKKPVGKIDSRTLKVGCDVAVDTGLYTFTVTDDHGQKSDIKARYTFVYEKEGGKWLIESHHSSGMPEHGEVAVH